MHKVVVVVVDYQHIFVADRRGVWKATGLICEDLAGCREARDVYVVRPLFREREGRWSFVFDGVLGCSWLHFCLGGVGGVLVWSTGRCVLYSQYALAPLLQIEGGGPDELADDLRPR